MPILKNYGGNSKMDILDKFRTKLQPQTTQTPRPVIPQPPLPPPRFEEIPQPVPPVQEPPVISEPEEPVQEEVQEQEEQSEPIMINLNALTHVLEEIHHVLIEINENQKTLLRNQLEMNTKVLRLEAGKSQTRKK
jgi:hypothetical protein